MAPAVARQQLQALELIERRRLEIEIYRAVDSRHGGQAEAPVDCVVILARRPPACTQPAAGMQAVAVRTKRSCMLLNGCCACHRDGRTPAPRAHRSSSAEARTAT